jgi:LacI family transcriptional regulator
MQIYNINCQDGNVKSKVDEILSIKGGGIVLMATEMDADDAQLFANTNVPLVMLDGWLEDFNFNSVLINNSDAAYKAVQYLIEQGHRKIGYLRSSVYINNFFYRFTGFRRAI